MAYGGWVVTWTGSGELDHLEELLWCDPDAAHAGAVAFLGSAEVVYDPVSAGRATLVQACVESQRGLSESSARLIHPVNAWAFEHDHPYLQARAHRALSALFGRVGDFPLCLEHAVQAVDRLDAGQRATVRCDHILNLATALATCGSHHDARRRFQEANELTAATGDPRLRMRVLNNWAYAEFRAGCTQEALRVVEHLQAVAVSQNVPLESPDLDTVARVYLQAGRLGEARDTLWPLRQDHDTPAEVACDDRPHALLTLAEIERLQGDTVSAQTTVNLCRRLCEDLELSGLLVQVRREQAELHAAAGAYREAFEEFKAFYQAASELYSLEREARARTLQVIFETSEARRDSAHYRQLSVHDALTGLPNRRFIDEQLTTLCQQIVETGEPLTVAIVDLDHFKVVNDTLSHETGDLVLCRIAELLTEQAQAGLGGGVAARLGGEEFVLILPGIDVQDAPALLEQVRRAVADHDWRDLTHDLPVTISIGSATTPHDEAGRSALLARADERLYAAKHGGRNRVVTAGPTVDGTKCGPDRK